MASRARVISYSLLAFLCLPVPLLLTSGQDNSNPQESRPEEIVVWKVGSPYVGDIPDTTIPPYLEQIAEKMGLKMTVEAFPAMGFAQQFFAAFEKGQEPDVVAINNYGIISGATIPSGLITGLASDETIREKLVIVTESLVGLEGSLSSPNGWEFLVTKSEHAKAARLLALRSPECNPRWNLTPLTQDLQDGAIPIARAYLQGDNKSLAAFEDPERLHTDAVVRMEPSLLETKGCGYWGDQRLAFVPVVSSYESAKQIGQISLLLILRKQESQWQLLAASTDLISVSRFPDGIPKLVSLLREPRTLGEKPLPAKLLAPENGQYPIPPQGQRFGNFVWRPSASTGVVAQIIEFAYNDNARLFLRFLSGNSPATDQISDGQLGYAGSPWKWRVWSISDSGAISFSEVRTFSE